MSSLLWTPGGLLISSGQLNLPVPDFVQINRDDEGKKIMISVLDKSVRKQRELWGKQSFLHGKGRKLSMA